MADQGRNPRRDYWDVSLAGQRSRPAVRSDNRQQSQIPRLVNTSNAPTKSTSRVINVHGDENISEPVTESTDRTARYHGKYTSYEDVLNNMDVQDPFQGEPAPPSDDLLRRSRERSQDRFNKSGNRGQHREINPETGQPRARKKKRKPKPPVEEDVEDKLNGTYTIMKDNPNYEVLDSQRQASRNSTNMYIGPKGESTLSLVPRELIMKSDVSMTQSPQKQVNFNPEASNQEDDSFGHYNERPNYYRSRTEVAVGNFIDKYQIMMRQCNKYIKRSPPDPSDPEECCCGRDYLWHADRRIQNGSYQENWISDKCTEKVPTSCFGTICFEGFGQEAAKNAPYIRIDKDTDPKIIWYLMEKHWKMPKPKLIISVTGGAKRFYLKSRLRDNFKRGLVNVATTTGAWIVTGGTHTGVMEFVGEALRDLSLSSGYAEQKVVAVGIATWGIVDNLESLSPIRDEKCGQFPAYYNSKDLNGNIKGKSPLDPNHTHFILVDNGMEKKFGVEIKFRAAMEKHIAHTETTIGKNQTVESDDWSKVTVPVVLLVLEGGENTISTAMEAIINNTPVVIIQGSGRAADVMAYVIKNVKEDKFAPEKFEETAKNPVVYNDVLEKVENWLDWSKTNKNKKAKDMFTCVKNIEAMLNNRNLLTVFFLDDIDTTNEIDQAILYALLKAEKSNFVQQLKLALAWNRCDIARQEIFKNENRLQWQSQIDELYGAMFTALVQNRTDFVQLFLDNGVEMKDFLNIRRLRELYDEVVNDSRSGTCSLLLRHLLQQIQTNVGGCCMRETWENDLPNLLALVGNLINGFAGDYYQDLYQGKEYLVYDERTVAKDTSSELIRMGPMNTVTDGTLNSARNPKRRLQNEKLKSIFDIPERDLLFWAVLLNRRELALMFWRSGKDHIGGAQIASALFKALGLAARKEEELDLSQELLKNANEFEDLATGVLNECYIKDKHVAHQLLIRSLDTWGGSTIFSMANSAEQMTLMGHSCCQTKLNQIWKGKMALYTSIKKIILGLIFFLFVVPSIHFTDNGDEKKGKVSPEVNEDTYHPSGRHESNTSNNDQLQMYTVECTSSKSSVSIGKAYYYYHTAPLVKFMYHTLAYLVFLGLFSFFLLTDMRHPADGGPSVYEYIVWGWAATMVLEEFRQIVSKDPKSIYYKLNSYFSSVWNQFDMLVYCMLILSIILRYRLPNAHFEWARISYALTLTLFFLRFMQTFYVEKNMGPKVIMIKRMLSDLLFFVLILSVYVLGYGIAVQALRYPNAELSWNILLNVVYMPYWHIYGDAFLDEMQSDTSETCPVPDPNDPSCPQKSWFAMLLLALYMIFTNVLLLNLLIAMFSHTFGMVQENSEKVWRFHRYGLVFEFFEKPTLAPPLIILSHIYRFFKFLHRCCKHNRRVPRSSTSPSIPKASTDFYEILEKKKNNKLTAFERVCMENFWLHKKMQDKEHIDAKVSSTGERIEKVIADLEQIKETVTTSSLPVEATNTVMISNGDVSVRDPKDDLGDHIRNLESRIIDQDHQMQDIHSMMQQLQQTVTQLLQIRSQPPPPPVSPSVWEIDSQNLPQVEFLSNRHHYSPQRNAQRSAPINRHMNRHRGPHIEIQEFPAVFNESET